MQEDLHLRHLDIILLQVDNIPLLLAEARSPVERTRHPLEQTVVPVERIRQLLGLTLSQVEEVPQHLEGKPQLEVFTVLQWASKMKPWQIILQQ